MRLFQILLFCSVAIFTLPIQAETNAVTSQQKVLIQDSFDDEFNKEFKDNNGKEVYDPFSGYNRSMTDINDYLYTKILTPVATGYSYVIPQPVRQGVGNMFDNLFFPIRFVNNLLQLKFMNALEETGRFIINTTFGLLGFFDPAQTKFGWEAHKEDFGQTLGFYGVGPGPHLVLPFLGPSNLRDAFSKIPDHFLDPISGHVVDYPNEINKDDLTILGIRALYYTNKTSLHLGEYENMKKDAFDLYPFLRDVYEQKRIKEIKE